MARTVYERDTDALFAAALLRPDFSNLFLKQISPETEAQIRYVERQSQHIDHTGTIDLDVHLSDRMRLLIENKIDAGYSITRDGVPHTPRIRSRERLPC